MPTDSWYCTLCGTVIPYGSEVGGALRTFGTSGLLYRSNKLMFDQESMSLWSSAEGRPVIGPLAGSGLELRDYPVVTTTWREWRAAHPRTTVLSQERLVTLRFAERDLVVVTTPDGANSVYEAGSHRFTRMLDGGRLQDAEGRPYTMDEDALRAEDGAPPVLARLPARRAFWFGWYAQFPDTELVTARR